MKLIFISLIRRLKKSGINITVNLFGLTIGITAFIFIFSWIVSEKNMDNFWSDADNMFRVELKKESQGGTLLNTARNYNGVGPVLMNSLPEVEAATCLDKDIITVFTPNSSVQNINMFFTDSLFFKVFPRPMDCENPSSLFNDIHNAAISRSLAHKLFGDADPLDKTFKLNEGWEFVIKAVFDDVPQNSHIKFDLILMRKALFYYMRNFDYSTGILDNSKIASFTDKDPYSNGQWKSTRCYTYLRLKEGCDIKSVQSKYSEAIAPCITHILLNNELVHFDFTPVKNIHLYSNKDDEMFANGSNIKVIAFAIISLLLIIITVLNYINLTLASAIKNKDQYKIHSLLGAKSIHLYFEICIETLLVYFSTTLLALMISFIALRNGSNFGGFIIMPQWPRILVYCGLLIFAGTLLSSSYIFFILKKQYSKTSISYKIQRPAKALIILQYAVSVFLIIGTMTIFRQIQFMQNTETGMKMDQTLVSFSPMTMIKKPDEKAKLETFRSEVQKIPGVKKFTTAEIVAGDNYKRFSNEISLQDNEVLQNQFKIAHVDYDYPDFFSIQLLNGKSFTKNDDTEKNEVIINESACKLLGLNTSNAVDKFINIENQSCRVIGIVKDFHQLSLKEAIQPVILYNSTDWDRTVGYYYIKISPQNIKQTIAGITELWDKLYPEEQYHYTFLDQQFNALYKADENFGNIYLLLSALTILIASMGLFALVIFSSKLKTKEIGIRKVNGARIWEVMFLLNKDFVKWVSISFVVATPIAYFTMNKWLENFAYKTDLSPWIFALAGIIALGIALITVSWQSWKAATRNPVEALRHE